MNADKIAEKLTGFEKDQSTRATLRRLALGVLAFGLALLLLGGVLGSWTALGIGALVALVALIAIALNQNAMDKLEKERQDFLEANTTIIASSSN